MKGRVTKTGYRRNSPDVNNDYNVIPSNRISMSGVDFPVLGIDNLGNSELMYPGGEYEFQGDYVTELPAYGSGGLTQWFAEKWVDIKTGKECGRSGKDKNGRPYPACRPSKRVNSTTPKTKDEMSASEKAKFKKSKTSGKRINYNHKRAQEGIEVEPASRRIRYEDGRMKLQDPAIYDGMLDEVTVTPYTQSELAWQEGRANLATGGLEPVYPIFDVMTLGLKAPATAGARAIQAGIKKAPSKINPRYFQPNSNMYYRGIGRQGMEDALESGLFRAKPSDKIPARMVDLGPNLGKLDMAKRFNKTYYSPRFNIADQYGAGYIAEVPKDAAKFSKRYKNTDWSMSTKDQIPISKGRILEKNWWSGYKPVEVPKTETFIPRSKSNYKFPTSKLKTEADVIHPHNLAFVPENIINKEVHSFLKKNNIDISKLPESQVWAKNGTDYILPEGVNHDILNEYARLHHNKPYTPEFRNVIKAIEELNPGIKIRTSHDLHAVASNIPTNQWWGNKVNNFKYGGSLPKAQEGIEVGNRFLPPAIRNMQPKEDPIYYDGIVGETTVTAPRYEGPQIRRLLPGEGDPTNTNFSFIGADRSSGIGALKSLAKFFKPGKASLAKNFNLKKIESAYSEMMNTPAGANMNIADDVFSGNTLYGKGAAFTKEETLERVANFQKDLSPVPFTYTHGTGSKSLPGIFKNKGLRGASELKKSNQLVTGEDLVYQKLAPHLYDDGIRTSQSSVSTASIANPQAAAEYAIEYGQGAGNYPIVFGINPKVGARSRMSIPSSTIEGEAMFSNGIGLDEISNIFVPDAQRASFIKNYGEQLGNIKLGSFDDYVNQAQSMGRRKIKGAKPYLYQTGREVGPPSLTPGPIQDKVYPMVTGPVEDSLENRIVNSTPVKPGKESSVKMQSTGVDVDRLRKGIKYAESLNGKLMMNPESTATGFYGQLFSEVKGKQFLKDIDRKTFAADTNLQNQVFDERLKGNEELFGIKKGLIDNGMDIYNEYKPILKDKLKYSPTELAALSNMLGRQGAREYVGYVLRDGKTLAEALPNIYGPNAKYKNHTPEEYIEKFNKAFNSQKPEAAKPQDTSKGPAGNVTMGMDIYDYEEGGESIPVYNTYNSKNRAWLAARKNLGRGKQFMYGGKVYSTSTPNGL